MLLDLKESANSEAGEDGCEENEREEKKESKRTVDGPDTGQEEMKTDVEGQEEVENKGQQEEEGDNNPGGDAGSLLGSGPNCADKKPESREGTQQWKCQNGMHCTNFFTWKPAAVTIT